MLAWCRELAARGYGRLSYPASCGGADDYGAFLAVFDGFGVPEAWLPSIAR